MRFTHFSACGLIAWQCAERAMRLEAQSLFTEGAVWLWWLAAAAYAAGAWSAFIRIDE